MQRRGATSVTLLASVGTWCSGLSRRRYRRAWPSRNRFRKISGRALRVGDTYYKNLAGLTQPQADAMQAVSLAALAELDALDRQAQTLIAQARAQGRQKLLPGQKPPVPPAQLAVLQTARKTVLNKYHDNLVQALGQSAFSHLEQALIANFKVGPAAPSQGTGH